MKTLDITKHKTHLTNILLDIYKDDLLGVSLGFKGGTAAMLFYGLPRFSVDLDFDLIAKKEQITDRMTIVLTKNYKIDDQSTKRNTLFWLLSYGQGFTHIKVEISTRENPYNRYNTVSFYGASIRVLDIRDMIAHKLVALMERTSTANRDLFDVHYFLSSKYASEINVDIIKHRTGKSPSAFYKELLSYAEKVSPNKVLAGLGEVLTPAQKDWAKNKLLVELKGLIQRQIDLT